MRSSDFAMRSAILLPADELVMSIPSWPEIPWRSCSSRSIGFFSCLTREADGGDEEREAEDELEDGRAGGDAEVALISSPRSSRWRAGYASRSSRRVSLSL